MADLSAQAIDTLVELTDAGFPLLEALEQLPMSELGSSARKQLAFHIEQARQGAPLPGLLIRLGLPGTAASLAGGIDGPQQVVRALRGDAASRRAAEETGRSVWKHVWPQLVFLMVSLGLAGMLLFLLIPYQIEGFRARLVPGSSLPEILDNFYRIREVWLGTLVYSLCLLGGGVLVYSAFVDLRFLLEVVHSLRLFVPFVRGHAIYGMKSRLAGLLARSQRTMVESLRTLAASERVPRFVKELKEIAARLEAGDPIREAFAGSILDDPRFRELGELESRGIKVGQALERSAKSHLDTSMKHLRHSLVAASLVILLPVASYTVRLLEMTFTISAVTEVENFRNEIERMEEELGGITGGNEPNERNERDLRDGGDRR